MSQARPQAWWRQARSDLDLAVLASRHGFQAQAIGTAKAVLAWVEGLALPEGEGGERREQ